MTTHLPRSSSHSIGPTKSDIPSTDCALHCPITQVDFQCSGAQAPRTLGCCGGVIATAALTCILCDLRLPRCPFCQTYLPLHNASDYPLDSHTISKLCTSSGTEDPNVTPEAQCARDRMHNDRQGVVDLFVVAEYSSLPEGNARKAEALRMEHVEVPAVHAVRKEQTIDKYSEMLLRIPPRGFVLQISRGCLIGRLREMIAAKMLVTPQAVRLKLTSEHILYVPSSSISESSSKCTQDSASESPFPSQGQAGSTSDSDDTSNDPRQAGRHCRASTDGSKGACQADIPSRQVVGVGNATDQVVCGSMAAQPGRTGRVSTDAPDCQEFRTGQPREWQPSGPSHKKRPTSPLGHDKRMAGPSTEGPNHAGSAQIRSSVEVIEGEESRVEAEGQQNACGQPTAQRPSTDGVLVNTGKADSARSALESHRLSASTHASSRDTWVTARSSEEGVVRDGGDQNTMVDLDDVEPLHVDTNLDTDSLCDHVKSSSGYMSKLQPSAVETDTSVPLSPVALSLLSEATANTENLSSDLQAMQESKQGTQPKPAGQSTAGLIAQKLQTSNSLVLNQPDPSGLVTLDNLHLRFDLSSVAERMESKWDSTIVHETLVHLDDDAKSLWDCDGRDQCTGLWRNIDDKWVFAVTKPQMSGGISAFAQEEFYALEERDGTIRGKLSTRLLMHAYIDITKVPCQQHRETLQTVLKAQQAASALQHYNRGPVGVFSRGDVQQASRVCAPIHGFAFQERICMLVVQRPTPQIFSQPNDHLAEAGHVQADDGHVRVGDHDGPYSCMQKVQVTQAATIYSDELKCDKHASHMGQSFLLLVGNGSIQEQLQLPATVSRGSLQLQNSV